MKKQIITAPLASVLILLLLTACSPRTVYVPQGHTVFRTDTLWHHVGKTDSVTVVECIYETDTRYDSIAPILDSLNHVIGWDRYHFRGSTKMAEREMKRLQAQVDSLKAMKRDSVEVRVPYPVERKLTVWERTKMELGGWAFGGLIVVVIAVAWLLLKKRRR